MGRTSHIASTVVRPAARREGALVLKNKALSGRVALDGAKFERCTFHQAVLVYAGGLPPRIQDCTFKEVSFEFEGAAGRSLAFLQAMTAPSSGLREVFKASFPKMFGH